MAGAAEEDGYTLVFYGVHTVNLLPRETLVLEREINSFSKWCKNISFSGMVLSLYVEYLVWWEHGSKVIRMNGKRCGFIFIVMEI